MTPHLPQVSINKKAVAIKTLTGLTMVGALAGFSFIIYNALVAAVSLFAIGAIGIVGTGVVMTIPLMGQKLENWIIKMRKVEARQNPIEQLENTIIARSEHVAIFKNGTKVLFSKVQGLQRLIEEREKRDPNCNLSKERQALEKMRKLFEMQSAKLKKFEEALIEFKNEVERQKFQQEFAIASADALSSVSSTDKETITRDLLAEEASNAISENFDRAFADLEIDGEFIRHAKTELLVENTGE